MREIFIKIKNCLAATANNYNKKKRQAEYPQAEDERITTSVQLSFDKKNMQFNDLQYDKNENS